MGGISRSARTARPRCAGEQRRRSWSSRRRMSKTVRAERPGDLAPDGRPFEESLTPGHRAASSLTPGHVAGVHLQVLGLLCRTGSASGDSLRTTPDAWSSKALERSTAGTRGNERRSSRRLPQTELQAFDYRTRRRHSCASRLRAVPWLSASVSGRLDFPKRSARFSARGVGARKPIAGGRQGCRWPCLYVPSRSSGKPKATASAG